MKNNTGMSNNVNKPDIVHSYLSLKQNLFQL